MRPTLAVSLAVLAFVAPALARTRSDVSATTTRANTLARSYALVHRLPLPPLQEVANPFNPPGFDGDGNHQPAPQPDKPATLTDRDVLNAVVPRLPIGGTTEFRGRLFLALGARRVSAGETLSIPFNGTQVDLEVVALTPTAVTLRYHDEELVRPIPH